MTHADLVYLQTPFLEEYSEHMHALQPRNQVEVYRSGKWQNMVFVFGDTLESRLDSNPKSTITGVSKNLTEPLNKRYAITVENYEEYKKNKQPVDAVLHVTYTEVNAPHPKTSWAEPNTYDCFWMKLKDFRKELLAVHGDNAGAFFNPIVCFVDKEHNVRLENMPCLCRTGQIFLGVQEHPHNYTDVEDGKMYQLDLFKGQDAYLLEVVEDCDDGSVCYVGQDVVTSCHLQTVPGQEEKYPDIVRKVP